MRIRANSLVLLAAACAMGMPAMAAKPDVAHVTFEHEVNVAGTKLEPGNYDFRVMPGDSKVEIVRPTDKKVIATVSGKWVSLKSKATYTQVLADKDLVQELDFGGKDQAVQFPMAQASEGQD